MFTILYMKIVNDMEQLGQDLRNARKRRGILQSDLAELAAVRRQVIGELERGVYKGSLQRALDVFRALGLRIDLAPTRFPTLDELDNE
jgi:DNA-binding XRE family transcriptional regulator